MLSFLFKSNQIRIQTDGKFQLKTIKDQYNHNSDPSSHRLNLFNKILLEIFSRNLFFFLFLWTEAGRWIFPEEKTTNGLVQ